MAVAEPMPPDVHRDFRLGEWVVRPSQNLLERDGERVHVRPKLVDVLTFLAERGGEVVPGEAIQAAVWGKRFLARSALSGAVSELRETLGDDPQAPRYIETVAKRGYRLVMPVSPEIGPSAGTVAMPQPAARRARWVGWAAVLVLVVASAVAVVVATHPAATVATPPRLVVLPFANLGSPDDAYFATGITDEITTRLARLGGLAVVASESARGYQGSVVDLATVGRELRVGFALQGSVRWDHRASGTAALRVAARLVRIAGGEVLWADDYDGDLGDSLAIQADIGRKVASALALSLRAVRSAGTAADRIANPEAYAAYLQGMYHVTGAESEDALRRGVTMLERAVELDPAFVQGWAALARAHALMYGRGYDRSADRVARSRSALARAAELAPDRQEVRVVRLMELFTFERDFPRVLAEIDALDPADRETPGMLSLRGYALFRTGKVREALPVLLAALDLDPRDWSLLRDIASIRLGIGELEQSRRDCRTMIEMAPDRAFGYFCSALSTLFLDGSFAAARADLDRAGNLSNPAVVVWHWWFDLAAGDGEGALRRLGELPEGGSTSAAGIFPKAMLEGETYDVMGRHDLAVAAFERARGPLEASLDEHPDDPRLHATLCVVYSGLGRHAEAIRAASRAVELCPPERDVTRGSTYVETLASVWMASGDLGRAMDELERLAVTPMYVGTVLQLSLDPRWKPLHADPRFQGLLARARSEASPTLH